MIYLGMVGLWQWIIIIIGFFGILLPIIALIDILKNKFKGNDKIVWVLVVIFFNIIGSILYFVIGKNQKIKTTLN
jgi:hypothetical protein